MSERWVLNASPIITLARVGYERLLWELPVESVVPRAVLAEIEAGPVDDLAYRVIRGGHFRVVDVVPVPQIIAWDLGAGETEVLSYAFWNKEWIAIVDDRAARKCAQSLGLRFKGTLAVVITARLRGAIPSAGDVLRSMICAGFRLDENIVRDALARTVGEKWD